MMQSSDVLERIDEMYEWWMERPHIYASTPRSLEEVFMVLDEIRWFILTGEPPPTNRRISSSLETRAFKPRLSSSGWSWTERTRMKSLCSRHFVISFAAI